MLPRLIQGGVLDRNRRVGVKDPSACLTIDRDISEGDVLVVRNENIALVSREKKRGAAVEQKIRTGCTWP